MARLARLTRKNQVTLPKDVVSRFPGAEYFDVEVATGSIILRPVAVVPRDEWLDGLRRSVEARGARPADVERAVRTVRRRRR